MDAFVNGQGFGRPKVVIIGAGLSGRGFLARLLHGQADITFMDKDSALVRRLREAGSYRVQGFDGSPMAVVDGYTALDTSDEEGCAKALRAADLLLTCVRAENGPAVGQWLTSLLDEPIPVIACENAARPADALRLSPPWQPGSAAIFCTTVADMGVDIRSEDYHTLMVSDGDGAEVLSGLHGFQAVHSFDALMLRKIYTYNAASAIIAYLGARRGYRVFADAARDADIDSELTLLYDAVNTAISRELGVPIDEQRAFAEASRTKFRNPHIADSIERNAANPERKLGATERIMAPARMILKHGGDISPLVKTAAAALKYGGYDHDTARNLLLTVSGLSPGEPMLEDILSRLPR